ncbi:BadF/BadG/BcrA/BcrD ATPase family protein [Thioalkalivibrio sp.]|uniref:BadF/BadG/BcrA/BcrD ATPase family protein n=1 Tax=Thioalkalivibrio sp. TaxID=2093813 RepID=UPI0012D69FF8|nr:BadF/BadG/BcrA/BcrD ATPase family protein [Thioalkalivibrio sp.]TVP83131.1 MAG: CoA activase [Thioalkalivibrio sp.]
MRTLSDTTPGPRSSEHPTGLVIGLDVGSTTVKAVVMDPSDRQLLWQEYRRHETRQAETVAGFLARIETAFPGHPAADFRIFVTGSGGGLLAAQLGGRFVQEVHAVSLAVEMLHPEVGSVVELGGQDAKIIVFKDLGARGKKKIPSMNDKCAGGTGAVIDKISGKLGIAPERLGSMGYDGCTIHPVAGKCGVFAETDINSLQKQGIDTEDLMASLFESIVQQNLSVLTRGHTLRPTVLLLGGPNTFIRGMQECWRRNLRDLWQERGVALPDPARGADAHIVVPQHAQYFAALGAAEFGRRELEEDLGAGRYLGRAGLEAHIARSREEVRGDGIPRGLVGSPEELEAFLQEFRQEPWQPVTLQPGERVAAFIGIDAGSTSTKGVLLSPEGEVLAKAYRLSQDNPIQDSVAILDELECHVTAQGAQLTVLGVGTTGYAKDIIRDVLHADTALVETVAHAHACQHFYPGTDVIVDVGGQDIKLLFLKDGRVRDFRLNTQCSAGNGYFLQATAKAFGVEVDDYADVALSAQAMPEFNHGCAVFLQSDIVDVQRKGWEHREILAGLAAVLPKNIWLYVAQIPNPAELGSRFVLQGGTQNNLAAVKSQVDYLRARFRRTGQSCDIRVHRHCGESGAIGCALEVRRLWRDDQPTSFIGIDRARRVRHRTIRREETRCHFCKNLCLRTFIDVHTADSDAAGPEAAIQESSGDSASAPPPGHRRVIVANCDKGRVEDLGEMRRIKADLDDVVRRNPNFLEIAARSVFKRPDVDPVAGSPTRHGILAPLRRRWGARRFAAMEKRRKLRIGLPRVLNLYSSAPFFVGYFMALGLSYRQLVFSAYTDQDLYHRGARRGSIDPCFPSKLGIAHVHDLLERVHARKPLTHVFFPMIDGLPTSLHGVQASKSCPTVVATAEATHAAFVTEGDLFARHGISFKKTFVNLDEPQLCARQMQEDWGEALGMSLEESRRAVEAGLGALERFYEKMRSRQRAELDALERDGRVGIGVLGRPYHNDPGVNHGILEELQRAGYPIFWQDALPLDADLLERLFGAEVRAGDIESPLVIDDVWKHSFSEHTSRKLWAAKFIARHPNLIALELSSFKCGHDAPIYSVVEEIIERSGTPYFCFKDLDENRPSGSIKIRTETIAYFLERYQAQLRRSQVG